MYQKCKYCKNFDYKNHYCNILSKEVDDMEMKFEIFFETGILKEALEETSVPSKYHEEILDTIERCLLNNTKEYFQPKGAKVSSNFSCSFFN